MKKNKQGQSLFELMMAVFVVSVTLVALIRLVSSSISNSTFSRDRSEAVKLTSEVSEWLRTERDSDWQGLIARASAAGTDYCFVNLGWDIQRVCAETELVTDTKFTRMVTLTYDAAADPNTVQATIVTTWSDSSGQHESRTVSRLSNWRVI